MNDETRNAVRQWQAKADSDWTAKEFAEIILPKLEI